MVCPPRLCPPAATALPPLCCNHREQQEVVGGKNLPLVWAANTERAASAAHYPCRLQEVRVHADGATHLVYVLVE